MYPRGSKMWQEDRPAEETARKSVCEVEVKREVRPQSIFLASPSNRDFQTPNIILKPSLTGEFPWGSKRAFQEWAEIPEGYYCVINLFLSLECKGWE